MRNLGKKEKAKAGATGGTGFLTEATDLFQVNLCPTQVLSGDWHRLPSRGWKAGCSWWESQGALGNLLPTPPRLLS